MYMLAPLAVFAVGVLLLGWRPSASTNAHVRIQMCLVCLYPLITAVEKKKWGRADFIVRQQKVLRMWKK